MLVGELASLVLQEWGVDPQMSPSAAVGLHNTVRCKLSEVACFQLTDDCALEFPAKFGFNPEEIRALAPFRFIARNNQGGEVRG